MKKSLLTLGIVVVVALGGLLAYLLMLPPPPPEAANVEQLAAELRQADAPPDVTPELQKLIAAYDAAPAEAREATLLGLVLAEPPTNLTPLLARIRTLEDEARRRLLEKVLVRTWAMQKEETTRALVYARETSDKALAEELVQAIVRDWTQRDLPRAQDQVLAWEPEAPFRTAAMIALLGELAKADPKKAYALTAEHMDGSLRTDWLFALFPLLAKTDPPAAGEAFLQLPADGRRGQAMAALVAAWRAADQDGLLEWIGTLPPEQAELQQLALSLVLSKWAGEAPAAAGEYVLTLPPGPLQTNMAGLVAYHWGRSQGEDALAWVETLSDEKLKATTATAVFAAWGETDPVAAAQVAGMLPASPLRDNAFGIIAPLLASRDIQDAADWVGVLPESPGRLDAVEGLATVWLEEGGEPADVYRYVATRLPKSVRDEAKIRFYRAWARREVAAAAASANKLPEGKAREAVLPEIYATWTTATPAEAAKSAGALPSGDVRRAVLRAVVRNWAVNDLPAARAWTEGLESEPDQIAAQEILLNQWVGADPAAALLWLSGLPEGKRRDALVAVSAERLVATDAGGTIELVETIRNKQSRGEVLERTAAAWLAASPGEAKAWIEASSLPEEAKGKLLE